MGIYGHRFDSLFKDSNIILRSENPLLEANIIIKGKGGKEIKLYVRDKHTATSGSSISKSNKVSEMNHQASIKLKTPKEITGDAGSPIYIYSGEAEIDIDRVKSLEKVPADIKKTSIKFINKNIKELNELWNNTDKNKEIEIWKKIVDNSFKDIKKLESIPDEVNDYFKSKLDNKKNGD